MWIYSSRVLQKPSTVVQVAEAHSALNSTDKKQHTFVFVGFDAKYPSSKQGTLTSATRCSKCLHGTLKAHNKSRPNKCKRCQHPGHCAKDGQHVRQIIAQQQDEHIAHARHPFATMQALCMFDWNATANFCEAARLSLRL